MKSLSILCLLVYLGVIVLDIHLPLSILIPFTGVLYLILNICYLYKYRRNQLICFEFLFAISFFLCSFLTPYVYPLLDNYQGRTFISTDYNLYKVYCISFIGYCAYMCGLCCIKENASSANKCGVISYRCIFNDKCGSYSNLLCLFFIVLFYLYGGSRLITLYSELASDLNQRFESWGEYLTYAMYSYTLSVVINFTIAGHSSYSGSLVKKLPFLFYFNTVLLVIPLLLSGLRSSALQLLVPLIMMYGIMIKRVNASKVLALICIGYVFMIFIGLTRSGNITGELGRGTTFLTFVYDFVSANGANSFLIDYTDKYGTTGGSNMLLQIASIIPFLQSFILLFVKKDSLASYSSVLYTDTFMDSTQGGLGTALIGDIYYSLGLVGVIILMFLIGYFINRLSRAHNSPYALALMMVISGNALFAPRVEYCYILRSLSYTVILLYIILLFSHNNSSSNEYSMRYR